VSKLRRMGAASAVALSLVAAACGGDDGGDSATATTAEGGATATSEAGGAAGGGGTITLGAEQEPDCMDWMGSCGGSSWGAWMAGYTTMPRAFDVVKDGDGWKYEASSMLAGEPETSDDPQTITYEISPDAKWSDNTPITCADFIYTWKQVTSGADIYDTTGYKDIGDVKAESDTTCVVTMARPYAGWKGTLFTGQYGIYPAHLLEGKDRNAEMKDGYTFSGGPWKIEKWEKGVSVSLVPNENYWGDKPKLDRVVFRIIPDTAQQFNAFKSGEVLAIYPQPQIATIDAMNAGGLDATQRVNDATGNAEALWMHNEKFPLDSVAVRQAIAYGIDRNAVVKALFGGIDVDQALNSLSPPITQDFADPDAFAGYTRDLGKVEELMTGDGWTKGADGIWAKDGQRASIEFKTTAGNKRRELTQQVVQQQLKDAGFEIVIANEKAGDLFGQTLPAGNFQMALYAQVNTTLDPTLCAIMCSVNIPTAANGNTGNNWTRTNLPQLDEHLKVVESSTKDDERKKAGAAADKIMAENVVSLPLDPLPTIALLSPKIQGDTEDHVLYSVFTHMDEWTVEG
jgi:peptide/nickel transport system substrate-binding protein